LGGGGYEEFLWLKFICKLLSFNINKVNNNNWLLCQ
jgi:hypothetical protein